MTPLMEWSSNDPAREPVVWWTRLDKRYQIEVVRTGSHTAVLRVFDHDVDNALLLEEDVGLAFEARFGPDADDVVAWQDRVLGFVDEQ